MSSGTTGWLRHDLVEEILAEPDLAVPQHPLGGWAASGPTKIVTPVNDAYRRNRTVSRVCLRSSTQRMKRETSDLI